MTTLEISAKKRALIWLALVVLGLADLLLSLGLPWGSPVQLDARLIGTFAAYAGWLCCLLLVFGGASRIHVSHLILVYAATFGALLAGALIAIAMHRSNSAALEMGVGLLIGPAAIADLVKKGITS